MTVTEDAKAFVREHRDHGHLVGDAAAPFANGYMLEVACPCGVTFARWVAPLLAVEDLRALVVRLAVKVGVFAVLGYLILVNAWVRDHLVRLLNVFKREGPR